MPEFNGLRCVDCDEPLIGKQKKFCGKTCNSRYNARKKNDKRDTWSPETQSEVLSSLQNGLTVEQTCRQAGIGTTTFYDRQASDQSFAEKVTVARELCETNARKKVAEAIEKGDMKTARWYLERKAKAEFSPRQEHTGEDGKPLFDGMSEEKYNALLERTLGRTQPE